jgi:hypothetical protein
MLPRRLFLLPVLALFLVPLMMPAQRVSPFNSHTRVYCVLDVVGKGSDKNDPFRPKHLPVPKVKGTPGVKILGWAGVLSADRKHYFVEVVADKRSDLAPMLNDSAGKWWDKETTPPATVEAELKKLQPAATLDRLRVRVK